MTEPLPFAQGERVVVVDATPEPNRKKPLPFKVGDRFVVAEHQISANIAIQGRGGYWRASRFAREMIAAPPPGEDAA